jgi:hypothetical protein
MAPALAVATCLFWLGTAHAVHAQTTPARRPPNTNVPPWPKTEVSPWPKTSPVPYVFPAAPAGPFAPAGTQAWAGVHEEGKPITWLGAPSLAQQEAMAGALQP